MATTSTPAAPAPAPAKAKPLGLGSVWSSLIKTTVESLDAVGSVAATANHLSKTAEAKAANFRATVAIEDRMTLAELRAEQKTRFDALVAAGLIDETDII